MVTLTWILLHRISTAARRSTEPHPPSTNLLMPHSWKMDIQRWLNDTVTPEQPWTSPDEAAVAPSNYRKQTEVSRQTRERTTSDSSFLDSALPSKPAPLVGTGVHMGKNMSSDAMHPDGQTGSEYSAQDYTRRPRRKTRIERYEAATKDKKKRGVHGRHREHGESTKAKRKTKRKRVGREHSDMVQSFHANNVSADRLTLKPRAKLGLFNNGRASSPVKGRGLPDLVFSEMKFLKRRDHDQTEPQNQSGKQSNSSEHSNTQPNEEVSAYFSARRSAQAAKNTPTHAKDGSLGPENARQTASIIDNAVPTIEVGERTSVPRPERASSRDNSESYISWSESIHAPSVVQAFQPARSTPTVGQLGSAHHHHAKRAVDDMRPLHPDTPPNIIRHTPDINEVPIHGPFGQPSADGHLYEPYSPSRSKSLPRHTNPSHRASKQSELFNEAFPPYTRSPLRDRHTRSAQTCQGGYIPPSVRSRIRDSPVSHQRHGLIESAQYSRGIRNIAPREDGTMAHLNLGDTLTDCNKEFDQSQLELTCHTLEEGRRIWNVPVLGVPKTPRNFTPFARRPSTVPSLDINAIHRPYVHGTSMPSIYEQQEQREFDEQNFLHIHGEYGPTCTENEGFLDEENMVGENRMIDHEPDFASHGIDTMGITNPLGPSREDEEIWRGTSVTDHVVVEPDFWRPHKLF